MSEERRVHTLEPLAVSEREVGIWLQALEEVRRGLMRSVSGLDRELLDWRGPSGLDNSIGTLLTHIAAVEMGWLYFDVLMQSKLPDELGRLMPYEQGWTDDGTLVHVSDSLDVHLQRLAAARRHLIEQFGRFDSVEWHTLRSPQGEDYSVTPAWVAYHLVEHEAGHLFEIRATKRRWKQPVWQEPFQARCSASNSRKRWPHRFRHAPHATSVSRQSPTRHWLSLESAVAVRLPSCTTTSRNG
jgi:hypothetical protein